MMFAYDEIYLDDAMCNLGEMLDYAVNDLNYDIDLFFSMFSHSKTGRNFEIGNPKYVTGMSGVELARYVIYEVKNEYVVTKATQDLNRTREYWTGYILAYYQHRRNISFSRLIEYGVSASLIRSKYILHEADISKSYFVIDEVIKKNTDSCENRLKRLRKYAQLTQRELSEKSGVSLRMIQLYEQGQNDLKKAQFNVVVALADTLKCDVRDLV